MSNIEPGEYNATVKSWTVIEIEKLDHKPQMVIEFLLESGQVVTWKDFFLKKDGTPNKKTLNTLKTCGFSKSKLSEVLDSDGLVLGLEVKITISKNDRGYIQVDWVNAITDGPAILGDLSKLDSLGLDDVLAGMKNAPTFDADEELLF